MSKYNAAKLNNPREQKHYDTITSQHHIQPTGSASMAWWWLHVQQSTLQ